jgi:hypothetical protein
MPGPPPPATPLFSDNISSVNVTLKGENASTLIISPSQLTFDDNVNLMNLNISSVNFSDSEGFSEITTTSLALNTGSTSFMISGVDASYAVTTSGSLNLNASTVLLNGAAAPGPESFITNGPNGLVWTTLNIPEVTLPHIEAGVFTNDDNLTSVLIPFNNDYPTVPSVILTSNANGNGTIVPIALDAVTITNFSVVFGSSALEKFSFAVLPSNNTYVPPAPPTPP